mgnify:FL=1
MLFSISQKNMKKDFTQIDPVISQVYELIQKAQAKEGGLSGLPTGFHELDKITNGWQNSDLVVIAARPAMGKTAFVLSMIKRMAVDHGIPCAMFSLEMSNQQLVQRLMVNVSELSGEKLRSGQLAPYEWGQLDKRVRQLYNAPIYIDDTPSLSVFELQTKARRLVREFGVKIIMMLQRNAWYVAVVSMMWLACVVFLREMVEMLIIEAILVFVWYLMNMERPFPLTS